MDEYVYKKLENIIPEANAHGVGMKQVFIRNDDTETAITQFAYGQLLAGELCPPHIHKTMEECFFFISGIGEYTLNDQVYVVESGTFLRIPAGVLHSLKALSTAPLTFIYFGVAIPD